MSVHAELLVTSSLTSKKPGFDSGALCVGFAVNIVAMGQVFVSTLLLPLSVRGGASKSLAQPTSQCHRTESIALLG